MWSSNEMEGGRRREERMEGWRARIEKGRMIPRQGERDMETEK